ncbi:MAG: FAD-binding protein [Burkholderiaceae bacterium]
MTPDLRFTHIDLTGMNVHPMVDAPTVETEADVTRLFMGSDLPMAVAGMRHSQGGHTALAGGRMLVTETYNGVRPPVGSSSDNPPDHAVVDAGATWSEIHRRVCNFRRSTRVQQSSAHFSVGGSLSVNCHGREVRWGPVSDTVEEITVLTGTGEILQASAAENTALFRAVLGGYGACGMILSARLSLAPNRMLYRNWDQLSVRDYEPVIQRYASLPKATHPFHPTPDALHLHHAWVNVSEHGYMDQVISYTAKEEQVITSGNHEGHTAWAYRLKAEGWGTSELLRAGWAVSRLEPGFRTEVWKRLTSRVNNPSGMEEMRINLLREDVLFTSSRGDTEGVDLLQEYFVPLDKLTAFLNDLKAIFPFDNTSTDVALLSSTIRLVKAEWVNPAPLLSYCRGKAMAGVAIDAHVKRDAHGAPTAKAADRFRQAIDAALNRGGTYYLPYHRFATPDQFKAGYPHCKDWLDVVKRYNPDRRFSNEFLRSLGV